MSNVQPLTEGEPLAGGSTGSRKSTPQATLTVSEVMTTRVQTCSSRDTLERAARIMWERDCGVVPILDEDGRVVSMVTDRDACMATYTQGKPLWKIPVTVAASRKLYVLHPNDSIETAFELMQRHRVRRLPVVDGAGQLLGIVSLADLVRSWGVHGEPARAADSVAATLATEFATAREKSDPAGTCAGALL